MRVRQLVSVMALALLGVHCASEKPAPQPTADVSENHPGSLVITSPARAAFIEGEANAPVEVRGTGATGALTIDGQRADVAADGSFHATVNAKTGLNIVVAVDGASRLETPFLFGHFAPANTPVAQAVALDIGAHGINDAAPATSLSSILSTVLTSQDLTKVLQGKSFSGKVLGATWTYTIAKAAYADAVVDLSPQRKGLGVKAALNDVAIDGTLSMEVLSKTISGKVTLRAEKASIAGDTELSVKVAEGALEAAMPSAEAHLDGFHFDSNNVGFPCCVDSIVSDFLEPKIEEAIRDQIKKLIPGTIALTLDGVGLPKELDLAAAGIEPPIPITTRFDGGAFELDGVALTASVLFGGAPAPRTPGAKAPGWLKQGQPIGVAQRAEAFGVSFSFDAINQLFFAAWGTGSLTRTIPNAPAVHDLKIAPALPPILTLTEDGVLRVAVGELVVEGVLANAPFTAAISASQDVAPGTEGNNLVLTPKGEPTIAITWLEANEVSKTARTIIADVVKDQLTKFLKPFTIPFPAIPLAKLGPSFDHQTLTIVSPTLAIDRAAACISVAGTMALVKPESKK
jgi:hypothetical protein